MKKTYCDMCGNEFADSDGLHMDCDIYIHGTHSFHTADISIDVCPDCAEDYEGDPLGQVAVNRHGDLTFTTEKRP